MPIRKSGSEEVDEVVENGDRPRTSRNPGTEDGGEELAGFCVEIISWSWDCF